MYVLNVLQHPSLVFELVFRWSAIGNCFSRPSDSHRLWIIWQGKAQKVPGYTAYPRDFIVDSMCSYAKQAARQSSFEGCCIQCTKNRASAAGQNLELASDSCCSFFCQQHIHTDIPEAAKGGRQCGQESEGIGACHVLCANDANLLLQCCEPIVTLSNTAIIQAYK